jgi:uncharacterized membrane protein YccF (DUF307 family)
MALLLNILWNIPGLGFIPALMWLAAAAVMAVTVIGLPWARACLTLAGYSLLPFGNTIVTTEQLTGRPTLGTGPLGWLANIVWFLVAGIWLCIAHLTLAAGAAVTIIGLPFAWAHLKLAAASLAPVGKRVVPNNVAEAALGQEDRGRGPAGERRAGPERMRG